jgi:prepilin-type N-terminal cleavage/methylation domain-containing protein
MKLRSRRAFTLIELMIVVAIIGVLASLAIPRFMTAGVRAKQSEAQKILKQIYVNQRTYFQENGTYWDPGGTTLTPATPQVFAPIYVELMLPARYVYTIRVNNQSFVATATANDPGVDTDPSADIWTIDDTGTLTNTVDDAVL